IRSDVSVEVPLVEESVQERADGSRLAVDRIVCCHHALHVGLSYKRLKCRQIRLVQVSLRRRGVKIVPERLRPAVHRKMLRASCCTQIIRMIALKATHKGHAQPTRQVRILTVGLLPSAPPWIPKDVDVGRPEGQPTEDG